MNDNRLRIIQNKIGVVISVNFLTLHNYDLVDILLFSKVCMLYPSEIFLLAFAQSFEFGI